MTEQNKLEAYKKAIQSKFDIEKNKRYANFLLQPSRANLRNLCLERMKDNTNRDDLISFNLFLGFEFSLSQLNKLKAQKDKFRPIETFFKRETDLSELEAVNIAAILVDFQPRPFRKYLEVFKGEGIENEKEEVSLGLIPPNDKVTMVFKSKNNLKKNLAYGVVGFLGLFAVGYTGKDLLFPEKQCMKWVKDHYEMVNCLDKAQGIGSYGTIVPYNEIEFNRIELKVCDTTEFFIDGNSEKPKVWYDKEKDELRCFNMDGINPETGDQLRSITPYMIDKYVKPCK